MPAARRALLDLCSEGINESVTQYWRLHQSEASGHIHDLERALATLSELEQARAQAWREAAHDLRGSLSVVKGATSMLNQDDVPEPLRHEFHGLLQRGVASLQEMLNDLMSLARLEAGHEHPEITSFDAAVLLREFCANAQPLATRRDLFLKAEGPDSLEVQGDRAKIQRIAQNLLLNALKYTRHGGVTVSWGVESDVETDRWMFCVQDTGPGLQAGPGAPLANQLYEATQTAREVDDKEDERLQEREAPAVSAPTMASESMTLPAHQQPGEGVGLSIVKRMCELLDATLELETASGRGSTFRILLPRRYDRSTE
jgi:signal transduction histidine kinase